MISYFNEPEFYQFVLDKNSFNQRFKFGECTLASGRKSCFKLDWEYDLSRAQSLDYIASCVLDKANDLKLKPELFIGVPQGVVVLGVVAQLQWNERTPLEDVIISRKEPAGQPSTEQHSGYVGNPSGKKAVYIEDTVTTGDSLCRELDKAAANNVQVIGVISLADRMQLNDEGKTAREMITSRGIVYDSLSNVPSLLISAYRQSLINEELAQKIEEEYTHLEKGWLTVGNNVGHVMFVDHTKYRSTDE